MGLRTRRLGTRLHSFFSTEMSSARFRVLLKPSSVLLYCLSPHTVSCRGNSKYHYYGIRVKPDSPLNRLQEDMQYMALRQQPVQQKQRYHAYRPAAAAVTQVSVSLDTEASHVVSGSSQCRSLMPALGRTTQVEASHILVQQSRRSLHRANTTSSS